MDNMVVEAPFTEVPASTSEAATDIQAVSPETEAKEVMEVLESYIAAKEDWMFLISTRWWNDWKLYTSQTDASEARDQVKRPGPIDNKDLVAGSSGLLLHPRLVENVHYVIVPERAWKLLFSWYGGGHEVRRQVYFEGRGQQTKKARVMVYPVKLKIWHGSQTGSNGEKQVDNVQICVTDTVRQLKALACEQLKLQEEQVELWDFFSKAKQRCLEGELDVALTELKIFNDYDFLLEDKETAHKRNPGDETEDDNEDQAVGAVVTMEESGIITAPPPRKPAVVNAYGPALRNGYNSFQEDFVHQREDARPGLSGLSNLGNTCFMNSSLQCLAHTLPLIHCFLTRLYKNDVNKSNPLGLKGELVEAFASLMHNLWKGGASHVAPRGFKSKIGKFAPQFSGYQQHDSQEFLAFLLDGLHEDLNRIKVKPYIEEKDVTGRSDEDLAKEAWTNYRARNDSAIVDHFQGLYKSTLDCPQCGYNSVKFDPFMYLSLPLPESRVRTFTFTLVHMDGSHMPVTYSVEMSHTGTIKDLCVGAAKVAGIQAARPEEVLCVAKVNHWGYNSQVHIYSDVKARVVDITDADFLVVYKYGSPEVGPHAGLQQHVVHHRRAKNPIYGSATGRFNKQFFAAPLLLFLPEGSAYSPEQVREVSSDSVREYILSPTAPIAAAIHTALQPFAKTVEDSSIDAQKVSVVAVSRSRCRWQDEPPLNPPDNPAPPGSPDSENRTDMAVQSDTILTDMDFGYNSDQGTVARPGTPTEAKPVAPLDLSFCSGLENQPDLDDEQEAGGRAAADNTTAADATIVNGDLPCSTEAKREPFDIKLAQDRGQTEVYRFHSNLSLDKYQTFTLEWSDDGAGVYDPSLLERPDEDKSASSAKVKRGFHSVSLSACVEAFLQPEQLSEADSWYCPKCKDHVQADKKLDLWQLPDVLVVHLKRFSYTRYLRDKLETHVDFPLQDLDLSKYMLCPETVTPVVYDLFAVSNHFGNLGGGHYTAFCKLATDEQWYCFDDAHVSPVNPSDVQTAAAYVLFYRRRPYNDAAPPLDLEAAILENRAHLEQEAQLSISDAVAGVALDEGGYPLQGEMNEGEDAASAHMTEGPVGNHTMGGGDVDDEERIRRWEELLGPVPQVGPREEGVFTLDATSDLDDDEALPHSASRNDSGSEGQNDEDDMETMRDGGNTALELMSTSA